MDPVCLVIEQHSKFYELYLFDILDIRDKIDWSVWIALQFI